MIALLLIASLFLLVRVLLANRYEGSSADTVEEHFVSIETREFKRSTRTSRRSAKTDEMVELNSADTTRLKMLRGIGSGYAKMIVAYREKLGGFYKAEQLLEVYKFPDETYQKIKHQLSVDTTLIRKIKINEATVKELKSHPYI